MSIETKREIDQNDPSLLPLPFKSSAEMNLETLSKEDLLTAAKALHKENISLKASLAAEQRDSQFYFKKFHNVSMNFGHFKAKIKREKSTPNEESEAGPEKRVIAKARKRPRSDSPVKPPAKVQRLFNFPSSPKHFRCKICPEAVQAEFVFEQIEEYRIHLKASHPGREWFCCWGPYSNATEHGLKQHCRQWNHVGEYKGCKLCGLTFKTPNQFSRHFEQFH